jgi:hypothetical protein
MQSNRSIAYQRRKVFTVLVFVIVVTVYYLADPQSTTLASAFATFVYYMIRPFMNVELAGNLILVRSYIGIFEDVCTGLILICIAAAFVWLREIALWKITILTIVLFELNLLRVVITLALLYKGDFSAATTFHNGAYITTTAVSIGIMLYGVLPFFTAIERRLR